MVAIIACAYCIVTIARGPSRSHSPKGVLAEIKARLAEGYQEIVLTGINIGGYGRERYRNRDADAPLIASGGWSLARLVRLILANTGVRRLRLSSIEPWDLKPELLALWDDRRLCRHIHLPLQSGCDDTLRRMGRNYMTGRFQQLVADIRQHIPRVSITTDIIVGFPGETGEEFERSTAFIERMRFSRLHVFKYSRRPGTRAAEMPHQIDPRIAQERSHRLILLGRRMALGFHARFVGQVVEVLFESARKSQDAHGDQRVPLWDGLTDNYLRVLVPSREDLANTLAGVRCLDADETGLRGELIKSSLARA